MPSTMEQKDALIDRYLNNKLSDVERAAFEIMMLEDAQLFSRVQLLDAFKHSLADESAALTGKRELFALPFLSWLQQPLSLAVSVLVIGLTLQVAHDALSPAGNAQSGVGIDTVFLLEAMRGADQAALSGAPPYLFQVDAGPGAAGSAVTASLRTSDGRYLLTVAKLQVDANGWVRFIYDQPLSGGYTVELTGQDGATAQAFDLTITD